MKYFRQSSLSTSVIFSHNSKGVGSWMKFSEELKRMSWNFTMCKTRKFVLFNRKCRFVPKKMIKRCLSSVCQLIMNLGDFVMRTRQILNTYYYKTRLSFNQIIRSSSLKMKDEIYRNLYSVLLLLQRTNERILRRFDSSAWNVEEKE